MSQQELAARAGLRREKVNRVESRGEDIGLDELCRLLDAVGLQLYVLEKEQGGSSSHVSAPMDQVQSSLPHSQRRLVPQDFHNASFIDGSRAKIVNWGKVPK